MLTNFTKFDENMNINIHETQQTPNEMNSKISTGKHIVIKHLKHKEKDNIENSKRENIENSKREKVVS